jgi:hypothetical protein
MNHHTALISKIAHEVYRGLGFGFSEDVYDLAMQVGLRLAGIEYESQKVVELKYRDHYGKRGLSRFAGSPWKAKSRGRIEGRQQRVGRVRGEAVEELHENSTSSTVCLSISRRRGGSKERRRLKYEKSAPRDFRVKIARGQRTRPSL